ncbi:hypothetical protein Tco_1085654 [Tanacetum coccineum]
MTIPNVPFPQGIGSGGSPRCQEAMRDTIARTRSERVSISSYDSPLLGVNTPGSDEERIKLKELMDICTKLSEKVDSETQGRYGHDIGVNTASTSITTTNINITTAEHVTTASAPVTIAGVSVSTAEPSTPPTTTTTTTPIEDEDLAIS